MFAQHNDALYRAILEVVLLSLFTAAISWAAPPTPEFRQVIVHVVSRRRSREMKQKFYELLASRLADRCDLDPADLIVSITENSDEDWSFGYGRAQFLTGELT